MDLVTFTEEILTGKLHFLRTEKSWIGGSNSIVESDKIFLVEKILFLSSLNYFWNLIFKKVTGASLQSYQNNFPKKNFFFFFFFNKNIHKKQK